MITLHENLGVEALSSGTLTQKVKSLLSFDFSISVKVRELTSILTQSMPLSVVNIYGAIWKDRLLTSEEK